MNRRRFLIMIISVTFILASCTSTWDGVVLPNDSSPVAFSPRLSWVIYEFDGDLWIASLPNLRDTTCLTSANEIPVVWSLNAYWMPDETGFLMQSNNIEERKLTWWLVNTKNPETRIPLCTHPGGEYIVKWSPAGNALVAIDRGGGVTLIHTDGSGCETIPIQGLVMLTPSISWSPDGRKIAYVHIPSEGLHAAKIRLIELDTYQTSMVYADLGLPEWFPSGEIIALFGGRETIPLVHADGLGLLGEIEIPPGYVINNSRGSSWSPDGSRLALYLEIDGPDPRPGAIGILDRETLMISVIEVPDLNLIIGWTLSMDTLVVLTKGQDFGSWLLREVSVSP